MSGIGRWLRERLRGVRWVRAILLAGSALLVLFVALVGVGYLLTDIPPANRLSVQQATVIRYADGEEIARLGTNREVVPLSQVSERAQKAVLAAEDRGFYTEPGISPRGIARALLTNVRGGGDVQQGGSTITQQYAKNAFLSRDGTAERTYSRKVKEVFLALKMTRERSKEQILEDYLNTIYFGRGAYGIQAASKAYFGPTASASTLTATQGAVLASSVRSPAGYEPAEHPKRARERFAYVLDGMQSQGWLTPQDREGARYPPVATPGDGGAGAAALAGPDGHVVSAVMDELQVAGLTEQEIDEGGLTITTTLRRRAQDEAVRSVQEVTADTTGKQLQGALVSVEPDTGEVVAYYGGANGTGLDYAGGVIRPEGEQGVLQEPGSSFKPYVLAAALEQGIPLTHRLDGNSPKEFDGLRTPINNAGDNSYGRVSVTEATRESVNTAYVELALEVGLDRVARTAHAAGIPAAVRLAEPTGQPVPSIALGVYGIHVTDQAAGYATFANGGEAVTPYLVRTVLRGEQTVYEGRGERTRAFSEDVAADATWAMRQVIESGTGTRAQLDDSREAAGKTGTTTDAKDVWFAGFTPQLSTAVWFGYGTPRTVEVDGEDATGGRLSGRVWREFMDAALAGTEQEDLPDRAYVGGDSYDEYDSDSDSDSEADGGSGGGDGDPDAAGP